LLSAFGIIDPGSLGPLSYPTVTYLPDLRNETEEWGGRREERRNGESENKIKIERGHTKGRQSDQAPKISAKWQKRPTGASALYNGGIVLQYAEP